MSNIDLSQMRTAADKQAARRADAMARLAELRWQHETGGLTLPDGTHVATTRQSQAQIASVMQSLEAGLITAPVDWKTASGWVQLSAAQISALAAAVALHVKACFAAERSVAEQLETLPGDLSDVDLPAAFVQALIQPSDPA